jgi:CRP/FNR family transcriptional regulator, cyclic AMP receptor protein
VTHDRQLVGVLDVDPELGDRLDAEARETARRYAVAERIVLPVGAWAPHERFGEGRGCLGLLVLGGLIKREIELANSACAELLGQGDVIRPWQEDVGGHFASLAPAWEVLEPAEVAVLDRRFAVVAGRWPEILDVLMGRSIQRSRNLTFHMALSHLTRVDVRLLALFWHLADRWGRVGPDGIVVPLRLPHRMLARLVGAQRPSVTTALGTLSDSGRLTRRTDGSWLLHGEPPADLRGGRTDARERVAS